MKAGSIAEAAEALVGLALQVRDCHALLAVECQRLALELARERAETARLRALLAERRGEGVSR